MIDRQISSVIRTYAKQMPVVSISGPRQSGKTTLAKSIFPKYDYINFELEGSRNLAVQDPQEFLSQFKKGVILDEIQKVPELFSYIQVQVDEVKRNGQFILTGSENFSLSEKISQSLAGRVAILRLLPLTINEIRQSGKKINSIDEIIFRGCYPRIYDRKIDVQNFYMSYIETYVERDVRQIINVTDLKSFRLFLSLCAGRIGQLINFSEIASHTGVDYKTIQRWVSVLEASYILFMHRPYFKNFSKRLVKTSKIYFYDTGIACSLLGITDAKQLKSHWARGHLFENLILSDLMKMRYNKGIKPEFYFWRNNAQKEIDILISEQNKLKAIEIKSTSLFNPHQLESLNYFKEISDSDSKQLYLVYAGNQSLKSKFGNIVSWNDIEDI